MTILEKIHFKIVQHSPSIISGMLTKKNSEAMTQCIKNLKVKNGADILVDEIEMKMIELQSGVRLIGHPAVKIEQKVLGNICNQLNINPSFAKILLDGVVRYTYPHVGGAVLSMDIPIDDRNMFHPQQKNFLLEETAIKNRIEISEIFQPQEGWKCLDIGAFLGHGAMWLREQVGATGKIICVEANEFNQKVIKEHCRQNQYHNIEAKFAAIWHTAGESITFNLTKRQGNAIDDNVVNGTTKIEVPTISIQKLTEELGQAADFVSLTVNGAEVEAIEGMLKMKKENLPKRILAPAWYPKDGQSRFELIEPLYKQLGYNYVKTKGLMTFAWLNI